MLRRPVRYLWCGAASGNSLGAQYHKTQPAGWGYSWQEYRDERATLFFHLRGKILDGAAGEDDSIGTAQGAEGLAEASGGQQTIANVLGREQKDIEITGQAWMLEGGSKKV